MFASLNRFALKLWAGQFKNFACPKCSHRFNPFEQGPPASWQEAIACPQCGWHTRFRDALEARATQGDNPPGPFEQPPGSKIERHTPSANELLFVIPASRKSNALLFFAVFWNLIAWSVFLGGVWQTLNNPSQMGNYGACLIAAIFPAIGIALAYFGLCMAFASHLLYLAPERIRLQREFFGWKKNYDLPTASITSVLKTTFYTQNYQPVHGIEIKGGEVKIRFGSALQEPEKDWLRWEIHEFIGQYSKGLM